MTKREPVWQISIEFPNGKKIVKTNCNLETLFDTYYMKLNIQSEEIQPEDIFQKYADLYSRCKVLINYIDSWGHRWTGNVAKPKKEKHLTYLNKKILEFQKSKK